MTWKVGDILVGTEDFNRGVEREIVAVRPTGYTWRYPDAPEAGEWASENSNQPDMVLGWRLSNG